MTDPVTGVAPRALLQPQLAEALTQADRTGTPCALFLFDVDFFKTVNDAYGHQRGDQVLRQLADRVKATVRPGDTLFRYGGDEFVLLLPETDQAAALRMALRLTDELRARKFPGKPPLSVSVSLGVATYPDDADTAEALLACADRRNYLAKRRGRGGAVADDADTGAESASARLWERDAALAVAHEFFTWLQADGRGALEVRGEVGVGHTRFLAEVGKVARLRGFTLVPVADVPYGDGTPVLLVADVSETALVAPAVHRLTAGLHPPAVLGLIYATVPGVHNRHHLELPLLDTVDLAPWSPAALRIWLRATLRGEPSRTLFNWLAARSGGLPARADRELTLLRERDGLMETGDGGWTVAPRLLDKPRRRRRLPLPMTPLVGRLREHEHVVRMLSQGRLVTLLGPGGIGKTRLSLSVATALAPEYEDGAVFVPLADATDVELMVAAIAHALGVAEVPGEPLLDTVIEYLADAELLLVLDNFEQVLDASAVIGELLGTSTRSAFLATSRERLSVYGEQVYQVPPLALPDLDRLPRTTAGVAQVRGDFPAIELFEERAQAVGANLTLTPQTLPVIARLCHLLDGLPLAIELAAAHSDQWRPEDLLVHLTHHLDELGGGARDLPARQQTLRGAIDWSFALLDPAAQRLFTDLAVFAGDWDADAALAACAPPDAALTDPADADPGRIEMIARLGKLAGKNLVVVDQGPDRQRYRMLGTIRAYAAAKLAADPESEAVHQRHAGYFLDLTQRSAVGLTGPRQSDWAERLEEDYQNLRAAIRWTLSRGAAAEAAQICLGLWRYWRNGTHLREGREWLDRVLAAEPGLPAGLRARVLHPAAILAATQDDHAVADLLGRESLHLAESVGDRPTAAQARNALGIAAIGAGLYAEATEHFQHSLAISREVGQSQGTAAALGNLTKLSLRLGDITAANEYADQCLVLERAAGNTRGILLGLECLGQIRLAEGDVPGARAALQESLALSRTLGDAFGEAMALHQLGLAAHLDGDRPAALHLLTSALSRRHEVGDREDLAVSLDCVAALTVEADPTLAVRLLAAAEGLRERHRLPTPPDSETRRSGTLAAVRSALDPAAFTAAWVGGRGAPLDLIVDQAVDVAPPLAN
jgi:diguanylate cyclase (GGDEF)-like protein